MTVCILGNNLTALTLAKALVNKNIYVEILAKKKDLKLGVTRTLGLSKSNSDFLELKKVDLYLLESLLDFLFLNFLKKFQFFLTSK